MQIVININDSTYEAIKNEYCILPPQKGLLKILWDAIRNGTPLPKGHGRLIDADALLKDVRDNSESYFADDFAHEWVDVAPTIIEADEVKE